MAGDAGYQGWLRLWRKSLKSAVFQDANLWQLWSYLMMRANYEERQLLNGRKLKPGQLVISNEKLAELFKCNKSTIHRRVKKLVKLGNIATHPATTGTLVTIVNWPTYNPPPDGDATVDATQPQYGRNAAATRPQPEEEVKKVRRKDKLGARFIKPTLQEVTDYCRERNNTIDPQDFLDHYEVNGWVQGRGKPIKSWKACVRTWENQRREETKPPESRLPTAEEDAKWNPTDGGLGL